MASINKKPAFSSDLNSAISDELVQADFEGRNLEVQDFHGVKKLLQQIFLKEHVDVSLLSDMLIAQAGLGSVLKQSYDETMDDDEDDNGEEYVFGVTSVLNLTSNSDSAAVKQLLELVHRLAKQKQNEDKAAPLDEILNETNKIGLLVNERFVNLPAKMADPLLTSLQAELNRMKKRNDAYKFDYFVLICKTFKPKKGDDQCFFVNEEEEIFNNAADLYLEYNVASQCDTGYKGKWEENDAEVIPHRRVLFIRANKLDDIITRIKEFVA